MVVNKLLNTVLCFEGIICEWVVGILIGAFAVTTEISNTFVPAEIFATVRVMLFCITFDEWYKIFKGNRVNLAFVD